MKKLKQFIIKNKQVKGFTLVEMVIVIAIIAMLILLIVPGLSKQKDRATKTAIPQIKAKNASPRTYPVA